MTYDIFSSTAPAMPKTDKSTKFIDFILSNASKDMREALVPMMMPALSAHLTETEFMYSDKKTSVDSCKQAKASLELAKLERQTHAQALYESISARS